MAKVRSQSFVIDASVAQAAGPERATHPTARHCRDFLLVAREVCHRAVFTAAIAAEWNAHQSGFARTWRRSMDARKKIERLDVAADTEFREQLAQAAASEKHKEAMLKDAHLIEAARAQGLRVAALDDTVRGYFRDLAAAVAILRRVCWINPVNEDEEALEWLRTGAPAQRHRMLGYPPREE